MLFRSVGAFLSDADIEAAIDYGRPSELPPRPGVHYECCLDMGGGRNDLSACCIGHRDGERFICDVIRGRVGSPHAALNEFVTLARQYLVRTLWSDYYAAEWVVEAVRALNMAHRHLPLKKSDLYLEGQIGFTRGAIGLPDHAVLRRELLQLERHVGRDGHDRVDHPKGLHDDHANALFAAMYVAFKAATRPKIPMVGAIVALKDGTVLDGNRGIGLRTDIPGGPSYRPTPPGHYLRGGQDDEPWRPYLGADGMIGADRWGPIGTRRSC